MRKLQINIIVQDLLLQRRNEVIPKIGHSVAIFSRQYYFRKLCITLMFLFSHNLLGQIKPTCEDSKLIMQDDSAKIFLFNKVGTEFFLKVNKRFKYSDYLNLNKSNLIQIDSCLKKFIDAKKINKGIFKKYVRQYFPYKDKKNKQKIFITLTFISDDEYNKRFKYLCSWVSSSFDSENKYISLVFDLGTGACVE